MFVAAEAAVCFRHDLHVTHQQEQWWRGRNIGIFVALFPSKTSFRSLSLHAIHCHDAVPCESFELIRNYSFDIAFVIYRLHKSCTW